MTVATGKNLDSIPRKVSPEIHNAPDLNYWNKLDMWCWVIFDCLPQTQHYFLGWFLLKFGLTVLAYLVGFGFSLQEVCSRAANLTKTDNSTINCSHILTSRYTNTCTHSFKCQFQVYELIISGDQWLICTVQLPGCPGVVWWIVQWAASDTEDHGRFSGLAYRWLFKIKYTSHCYSMHP